MKIIIKYVFIRKQYFLETVNKQTLSSFHESCDLISLKYPMFQFKLNIFEQLVAKTMQQITEIGKWHNETMRVFCIAKRVRSKYPPMNYSNAVTVLSVLSRRKTTNIKLRYASRSRICV